MAKPNKLFSRNGHTCEMYEELDLVAKIIPGNSYKAKIKRFFLRAKMISETNQTGLKCLRSQAKISYEKEKHLTSYMYMIHPFSDIRKWWEFFMFFVFYLLLCLTPIDYIINIRHKSCYDDKYSSAIKTTFDFLCIADIIMTFFTGYWDENRKDVILKPKMVAMNYLQTYFLPDFLSSIPFSILYYYLKLKDTSLITVIELLFIFRYFVLFRITRMNQYGRKLWKELKNSAVFAEIINVIIHAFLFFCWVRFFMLRVEKLVEYVINTAEYSNPKGIVLRKENITGGNKNYNYTTVMTDTETFNKLLQIFTTSSSLISIVFQTLLFFFIVQIYTIPLFSHSQSKYDEMVFQLTEYMNNKKFPIYLQKRLILYYEFRFQKSYFRESEILTALSGQLKQELLMHSCDKLVGKVSFFKNLPIGLLIRIATCLTTEVFLPNDVIIKISTTGQCMYFIASGAVAVYSRSGRELCHLEDGDHFGEIALILPNNKRTANVVAVDVCELYRLNRNDFIKAIMPYPDLLIKIEKIAHKRLDDNELLNENDQMNTPGRNIIFL